MSDETPACYGLHEYFDQVDDHMHKWCAKVCADCPILNECAARRDRFLDAGIYIEGTWAGRLYGLREPTRRPTCGSGTVGDTYHRKAGERVCEECAEARRQYERTRYRRKAS